LNSFNIANISTKFKLSSHKKEKDREKWSVKKLKDKIEVLALTIILILSMYIFLPSVGAIYTIQELDTYDLMDSNDGDLKEDINNDSKIDMKDVSTVAKAYGSYPEELRWNWKADINNDGKIDMYDVGSVAKLFGKWEPHVAPVAYSTDFTFTVPNNGDDEVHYYIQVKFYVPSELAWQNFYLIVTIADDGVGNIKLDDQLMYSG
jgi:hypothetical protein